MRNALSHAGRTQRRMVSAEYEVLAGAMPLGQCEDWALQRRRYMQQREGPQTLSDTAPARLPAVQR